MTVTAPPGHAIIWIPVPTLVTVVKRNCRLPQQYVDIDCKPVSVPKLTEEEAPEVLDVKLRTSEIHYIYRRWNDALWSPARSTQEQALLAPEAFADATKQLFEQSFQGRSLINSIQPDIPCLMEELAGPRQKPPEPILLSDTPLREILDEGEPLRERSFKHASENLVLIDGIVHHRQPEPVFVVSDPLSEGVQFTRISFRMPRLSEIRNEHARSSRDEWAPWREFRANELTQAVAFARSFGHNFSYDLKEIQYGLDSFPEEGLHNCSLASGRIERAFGLIRRGAGAIGHMNDEAMTSFMTLRQTLSGLGARMQPAAVRALSEERLLSIQIAILDLSDAVAKSTERRELRSHDPEFVFRRACAISRQRELMSSTIETDPSLDELAA